MATLYYNIASTSAARVFNAPYTSNFKEAILDSIFNGTSLPKNLIRASLSSFKLSLQDYYDYGATGYYDRLPSNTLNRILFKYPYRNNTTETTKAYRNSYPIATLKEKNRYIDADKTSTAYKSTKTLLDTLPINSDTIFNSVRDVPGETDAIYFGAFVNVFDTTPSIKEYLWIFFNDLKGKSYVQAAEFADRFNDQEKFPRFNSFSTKEGDFGNAMIYGYIATDTIAGNIGDVGTVTVTVYANPDLQTQVLQYRSERTSCGTYPSGRPCFYNKQIPFWAPITAPGSHILIQKQTSTNTISRLGCNYMGLMINVTNETGAYKQIYNRLSYDPDQKRRFIVPLIPSLLNNMSNEDIEEIQYYGLHIQSNTGKFVTEVVESNPWESFINMVVGIASAFAGNMTGDADFSVLDIFLADVFDYLTDIVVDWLVESDLLDEKIIAVILNVVSSLALLVFDANGSGIKGLPWAESLMKATTLFKEKKTQQYEDSLSALAEEHTSFTEEYYQRKAELDEKETALNASMIKDPLKVLNMGQYFNPNESPSDFYERAIHNSNPGVKSLDAIEYFIAGSLKLPEANTIDTGFAI